ncbi:MAG: hypothetical protein J0I06_18290 [Planctomycetes bacterium]|nr:hypothetical protein [Planctomycetota bacterium]
MKLLATTVALVAGLGAFVGTAGAADKPGLFLASDDASLFSAEAKKQAERKMSGTKFGSGLNFNVSTVQELPAAWKKKYDDATDKGKVMRDWAKSVATKDKAKGPFVLICMKPGYTVVLADEETVNRGFTREAEGAVQKIFDTALREAAKLNGDEKTKHRDAALLKATDYIVSELKGTRVRP